MRSPTKQLAEMSDSGYCSTQLNGATTPSSQGIRPPPDVTEIKGSLMPKLEDSGIPRPPLPPSPPPPPLPPPRNGGLQHHD